MAGRQIDVNLSVNDSGGSLKKRNEEAKQLNQNLTRAAQLAEKALKPAARFQAQGEGTEYGRARGSMGTTGASARDFANQAQGLGGLVRVYATVAANLFAVTAAFNALKDAANTTSMVKGMDQLGAASGVALGTMAQRFVQATDGAISLREAMSSVTKASAAGLSSKQIIEIGQFAKTASQALGLDMTDAVNRLTRGITKLEPELLDELGLFTKIGPAADKYAASVGKSAASLTDFERRQAFANAVLDEARTKFGQIELASNPYQKLEANIRNLTTAGLELVNSFLSPIIGLVSNSGLALVTVLGLIGAKLTGMAIPALAGWRDELVSTAKEAKARAQEINESFGEKFVQRTTSALKIPDISRELRQAEQEFKAAQQRFIQEDNNIRQKSRSVVFKSVQNEESITQNIARLRKDIADKEKLGGEANLRHAASLNQMVLSYERMLRLRQQLTQAENQAEKQFTATNLEEQARLAISKRAGARAERLDILSQVGANVEAGGFRFAIQELDKGLKQAVDLKGWAALRAKATGWAIAGASAVGVFLRALSGIGNAILVGIGVFTLLDGILSRNADSLNDYNSQLKQTNESTKTAASVTKLYGDAISAASIQAKGNILGQLNDDLDSLSQKLEKTIRDAGPWDKLKDLVFGLFGQGLSDSYSQETAKLIVAQVESLPEGELRSSIEAKLKKVLGVSGISQQEIQSVLEAKPLEQAIRLGREANKTAKEGSDRYKELSGSILSVEEAVKAADLRFSEIRQSLNNTDPVTRFGASLLEIGFSVQKAAEDSQSAIGAIDKLLTKPRTLALLGDTTAADLANMREVYENLQKEQTKFNTELKVSKDALETLSNINLSKLPQAAIDGINKSKQELKDRIGTLEVQLEARNINIKQIEDTISGLVSKTISEGFRLMESMVKTAMERAALSVRRNLISGVSAPGAAAANLELNLKDISLQQESNRLMAQLNNTMSRGNILEIQRQQQSIRDTLEGKQRRGEQLSPTEQRNLGVATAVTNQAPQVLQRIAETGTFTAKEIAALDPTLAKVAAEASQTTSAVRQKDAELNAKRLIELDNARLAAIKEQQDQTLLLDQARSKLINTETQILALMQTGQDFLTETQILNKEAAELAKLDLEQTAARKVLQGELAVIEERIQIATERKNTRELAFLTNARTLKQDQISQLSQQERAEQALLNVQQEQFKIANKYAQINRLKESEAEISQIIRDIENDRINSALELLDIRAQVNLMMPDEVARQELMLRTSLIAQETANAELKAETIKEAKIRKLQQDRETALAAAAQTGTSINEQYYTQETARIEEFYNYELQRIRQNSLAKQDAINLQFSMTDRMRQYDSVFKRTFESMANALLEFVQTGKLNFKSLINSMIADLLRYELQQQAMLAYQAARPGIMNFLASVLPSMFSSGSWTPSGGPGSMMVLSGDRKAKGAAYVSGVEKFAKGGMFTNQIVAEPTLFKFAKGTGLMGEAGPEAIMPLRRDSDGNLGVMAKPQGGNVEVIVNNFSGEKAEARETVDSRGNRKIEVIVGEMVAGELGRKNSPVQQSMMTNFMAKPAVVRR